MFERRQYTFDIPPKKLKYLTLLYAKTIQYSTWFISPNQNFTNTKKFHCQVIFRYIDLFELIRRQYLLFDISFKKLKYLTFFCIFYTVHDVSSQINKSSSRHCLVASSWLPSIFSEKIRKDPNGSIMVWYWSHKTNNVFQHQSREMMDYCNQLMIYYAI